MSAPFVVAPESTDLQSGNWTRSGPEPRDSRRDAVLAGVLLIATGISVLLNQSAGYPPHPAPAWQSALYVLAISVPLAFRRRWPATVLIVIAVVFPAAQMFSIPELLFANISLFIAMYSVGAWGRNRARAKAVRILVVVGMFVWLFAELISRASDPGTLAALPHSGAIAPVVAIGLLQIITNLLYFGGAFYFGDRAWSAARSRAALEERTVELANERAANAQRAVTLERLRIARDLHDVVAHHVSVMGVQAGAARRVLGSDPAKAGASLESIESSARIAVTELHRMLTTLRDDETPDPEASDIGQEHSGSASAAPSTLGVSQLETLIAHAAAAGLRIRSLTIGEPRAIPATIDVVIYRIAQEAITNCLKHAGLGAEVDLRIRYLASDIELELSDNGNGSRRASAGSGLGQQGMRERVAAVGGRIEIGPRTRGGYLVRATIPTDGPASDSPASEVRE